MFTKKVLCVVLIGVVAIFAISIATQPTAHALPAPARVDPGITIPYSGHLTNAAGQSVADSAYDFSFALYDSETGGTLLWAETQRGVMVKGGTVVASLGVVNVLDATTFNGAKRWLAVSVRGPGDTEFTLLTPRQPVSTTSSAPQSAPLAGPSCPHNHWGEVWAGSGNSNGLVVNTAGGYALEGTSSGSFRTIGVLGISTNGFYEMPSGKDGVYGLGDDNGVYGTTSTGYGTNGRSASGVGALGVNESSGNYAELGSPSYGAHAVAFSGDGVYAQSTNGAGVHGISGSGAGGYFVSSGNGHDNAALRANSTNFSTGIAAYLTNNSNYPTAEFDQNGNGTVLDVQSFGTGDFIDAYGSNPSSPRFRVANNGDVKVTGSLSVDGPATGFFPRPAYDSGWVQIPQYQDCSTLNHNLGGNTDNYVIDLSKRTSLGIGGNFGDGGFYDDSGSIQGYAGYWYESLTNTSVTVCFGIDALLSDSLRIRIWVYK